MILGKIVGVFGVKGWLKIRSFTDPQENILTYQRWNLTSPGGSRIEVQIESARNQSKGLIVKFKGCADRDEAASLVGSVVTLPAERLPNPGEGEYYWFQLEALSVFNVQGEYLGDVSYLLETGANDVLVVKPSSGSIDDRERMIPYLPEKTVVDVLLTEKRILVDWDVDY